MVKVSSNLLSVAKEKIKLARHHQSRSGVRYGCKCKVGQGERDGFEYADRSTVGKRIIGDGSIKIWLLEETVAIRQQRVNMQV